MELLDRDGVAEDRSACSTVRPAAVVTSWTRPTMPGRAWVVVPSSVAPPPSFAHSFVASSRRLTRIRAGANWLVSSTTADSVAPPASSPAAVPSSRSSTRVAPATTARMVMTSTTVKMP
ncbi:hypothetical protein [Dactylosporangium cerinum]